MEMGSTASPEQSKGLFFGDASQLLAQLICVAVLIIWGFGSSYLFYKLLHKTMGIRVSAKDEIAGLDIPEMGVLAYPDFQMSNPDYNPGLIDDEEAIPAGIANNMVK